MHILYFQHHYRDLLALPSVPANLRKTAKQITADAHLSQISGSRPPRTRTCVRNYPKSPTKTPKRTIRKGGILPWRGHFGQVTTERRQTTNAHTTRRTRYYSHAIEERPVPTAMIASWSVIGEVFSLGQPMVCAGAQDERRWEAISARQQLQPDEGDCIGEEPFARARTGLSARLPRSYGPSRLFVNSRVHSVASGRLGRVCYVAWICRTGLGVRQNAVFHSAFLSIF